MPTVISPVQPPPLTKTMLGGEVRRNPLPLLDNERLPMMLADGPSANRQARVVARVEEATDQPPPEK